jgi:hypothetical protein
MKLSGVEVMSMVEVKGENRTAPRWAGVLVAVVLLGSMLAGGAVYYFSPEPPKLSELTEVPGVGQPAVTARTVNRIVTARPAQPVSGITKRTNGYLVRAPGAQLTATKPANAKEWQLSFLFNNKADLIPADLQPALVARTRLPTDAAFAKYLKVTAEQIEQLKKIAPVSSLATPPMVVSDDNRKKVAQLVDAYAAKEAADTEQALVKALQDVAAASEAPTKADIAARAEQIRKILTAEQLAGFKL